MLCTEIMAVCCQNHTSHIDTLCEQNYKVYIAEAAGTYISTEL